ncbi:MAG TPA: hypothetical protein VFD63_04545 [Pyrinomonadaceae bacterium]|jgi:hypothetical protein|nr:hypothetical protein [Pyrinomonadaceae bacterium]
MAATDTTTMSESSSAHAAPVPKRITNAQTVCNERNEKGKLCNGHLKQLRTAGEPSEVHLRGDDVLSKCQTCGTLYMGPPLGHVRDPYKQSRFVEAELTALLQAAGGTLPVIKKDERGVFVMVEAAPSEHGTAAKPAPAKAPAAAPKTAAAKPAEAAPAAPATPAAAKTTEHKAAGAQPNRALFKRSTYVGVTDTGPIPGETFEQKVARLKALSAAAKQRAEEGGEPTPAAAAVPTSASAAVEAESAPTAAPAATQPASSATAAPEHKATGNADRTLMKRSTYCGVVDTGPVPGETFQQKVARLTALSAAAKQRSEES